MASENGEWLRILVSAVAGMFAGLLADPVRGLLQSRIHMATVENALLTDFSNLSKSGNRVNEGELPSWKFWQGVELPAFDYYWEKNRELFYTNERLQLLRLQCGIVLRLRNLVESKTKTPDEAMVKFWEVLTKVKVVQETQRWKRLTQLTYRKQPRPVVE
jgi:hypothetical protein